MPSQKFIVDTNVIFSALYSPISNAGKLIELAIERKVELHAPEEVKKELVRNLKKKLQKTTKEIELILNALPISWLDFKLYEEYLERSKNLISEKDTPLLAAQMLTQFPIITGDKEFFQLKSAKVISLAEVLEKL